jgi:hypothetical protein
MDDAVKHRVRLDAVSSTATQGFRAASSAKRGAALLAACERAVEIAGIDVVEVLRALAVLRGTDLPDPSLPPRLQVLAVEFDDAYIRMSTDETPKQDAVRLFSKARAVAALAYALSRHEDDHLEAIYEAAHAESDPSAAIRRVESLLQ